MNFEVAATGASQGRTPQPGAVTGPGNSLRPAPIAAKLEVTPWIVIDFDLSLAPTCKNKMAKSQIANHKS